jgi:pimeloyl-ACP methyl ester carboxylesterase
VKILLLHAFPLDERMWEPQLTDLGDAKVDAPRLYGLGRTVDEWADALAGRLEEPAVVVGSSMGGYAALALARHSPERVLGVLLAGSRPDPDTDDRRRDRARTISLIQKDGAGGLWESLRPKLLPDDAAEDVVERARSLALDQKPEELIAAVEAMRDRPDASDVAVALGDRLLVAVGNRDPFVPGREAHSFGEGAAVAQFEGAGHLLSLERPEHFSHVVRDFAARWK